MPSEDPAFIMSVLLDIKSDQHTWDTVILCSLIQDLFGRTISSEEIADVLNAREGLTEPRFGSFLVGMMFRNAQDTFWQGLHPTCRYKKWEEVKRKLVERGRERDYDDKEEMSAWVLYNETLTTANVLLYNQLASLSDGCSEGSEYSLAPFSDGCSEVSEHSLAEVDES